MPINLLKEACKANWKNSSLGKVDSYRINHRLSRIDFANSKKPQKIFSHNINHLNNVEDSFRQNKYY